MKEIKSFEDACAKLGEKHPSVQAYLKWEKISDETNRDITAYPKLRIISEALNDGWNPKSGERKYYPWFYYSFANEGELTCNDAYSKANCYPAVEIALKDEETAVYCGNQFIDIWKDFFVELEESDEKEDPWEDEDDEEEEVVHDEFFSLSKDWTSVEEKLPYEVPEITPDEGWWTDKVLVRTINNKVEVSFMVRESGIWEWGEKDHIGKVTHWRIIPKVKKKRNNKIPERIFLKESELEDRLTHEKTVSCDKPLDDANIEYINLSKLWHEPEEEPREKSRILLIKGETECEAIWKPNGYFDEYPSWQDFIRDGWINRWAYVDDLMTIEDRSIKYDDDVLL